MLSIREHELRGSQGSAPTRRPRAGARSRNPNRPNDDRERCQLREMADVFPRHTGKDLRKLLPTARSGGLSWMSMILFTFVLATSWLSSEAAHAYVCVQNYYVDGANGKDSNPGSATQPWQTVSHASWNRLAGDCVNVRPGIYVEAPTATIAPGQGASNEKGYFVLRSVTPGRQDPGSARCKCL
jgi:hypothetical protein